MRKISLAVGLLLLSLNLYADPIDYGQKVPNLCWNDSSAKTVCVDDFKNTTRILIYSAGF